MKVYILFQGSYSDKEVLHVFSSMDSAEECIINDMKERFAKYRNWTKTETKHRLDTTGQWLEEYTEERPWTFEEFYEEMRNGYDIEEYELVE